MKIIKTYYFHIIALVENILLNFLCTGFHIQQCLPVETFISYIFRSQGPCFLSFIVNPTRCTTLWTWHRKCAHVMQCVKLWQPQPTAYKLSEDPPCAYKPSLPPVVGLEMTKPQTECKRNTKYSLQSTAVGSCWCSLLTKRLKSFINV